MRSLEVGKRYQSFFKGQYKVVDENELGVLLAHENWRGDIEAFFVKHEGIHAYVRSTKPIDD